MSENSGPGMRPSTLFAGDSSPDAIARRRRATLGILILFFISTPLTFLSTVAVWSSFSWGRISWKVSAFAAAVLIAISVALLPIFNVFSLYLSSWRVLAQGLIANASVDEFFSLLPGFFIRQLPGSLVIGVTLGALYSAWAWYRRPVWEQRKFRPTPVQWWLLRKHVEEIQKDENSPNNGTTLGVTEYGRKVIQSDSEASAHTFIAGASGSGKTTTMMLQARDVIKRGHSLVVIDLKGGQDIPAIIADYAERYERKFSHWLMHPFRAEYTGPSPKGPAYYDPIGRGDATRRKDLLVAGRKWNEEYYKILASSYLQAALDVAINVPRPGRHSFDDVIDLLNPDNLRKRALDLPATREFDTLREDVDRWVSKKLDGNEKSAISGMRDELQTIRSSVAGHWLSADPSGSKDINLKRAAHTGEVIVFSLDASNYEVLSKLIANLIIQDLKTVTSELRLDPAPNPIHIFIDEFSAADSDNILGLINKSRDARMPVTLATQALADLKRVDDAFLDQMLGVVNCFIIHRANTDKDGELYAGLTGKEKRWNVRYAVEHSSGILGGIGTGAGTGQGHVEEKEDFRVSPSEIQDLERGQIIYLAKSPKLTLERVNVIPEEGKVGESDGNRIVFRPSANITPKPSETVVLEESRESKEEIFIDDTETFDFTPVATKKSNPEALQRIFSSKMSEEAQGDVPIVALEEKSTTPKASALPARPTMPTRPQMPAKAKVGTSEKKVEIPEPATTQESKVESAAKEKPVSRAAEKTEKSTDSDTYAW